MGRLIISNPVSVNVPGYEAFAARMNGMPKYVASRTLSAPGDEARTAGT